VAELRKVKFFNDVPDLCHMGKSFNTYTNRVCQLSSAPLHKLIWVVEAIGVLKGIGHLEPMKRAGKSLAPKNKEMMNQKDRINFLKEACMKTIFALISVSVQYMREVKT
jgi:hypothetical protein